ncbi:MAG: hypothetical protein EP330_15955 [Deltaproteobacteria bacterium]|nr:MAG: hypothetical protein EP330_15955 [Deltaproteobacteria bacterium]
MRRALGAALLLSACSAETAAPEVWLVDSITLEGQPKKGHGIGFDLDGVDSPEGDPASCGHGDLLGLDLRTGVDNQFSALLPAMELVAGEAVHALVQEAIDSGSLLITLRLDPRDDELLLARAEGPALNGADGGLIAGQTVALDPSLPSSSTTARLSGARVRAEDLTIALPMTILGYDLPFTLHHGAIEMDRDSDRAEGVLGGLVSIEEMQPTLDFVNSNGDPQIAEPVRLALDANADVDLDEDGDCDHLSLAARFTAVPAWIYEEP